MTVIGVWGNEEKTFFVRARDGAFVAADSRTWDYREAMLAVEGGAIIADYAPDLSVAWAELRARRDQMLSSRQWIVDRHRDQQTAGGATTLTEEQFAAELAYRQALRDLPANTADPARASWPKAP